MKKEILCLAFTLLFCQLITANNSIKKAIKSSTELLQNDTVLKVINLKDAIITATRTFKSKTDIPAQTQVITKEQILNFPTTSIDDLFRTIPNVVVNRSWGVFSKNSSITMRGMDASARTLILLNGTPMNKTAGGTIIWDMINPESIERIEVVKGPGSALYGNNAMAGVINIITKTPKDETLKGGISAFAGSHNYYGGNLNLGQNIHLGKKKWFWQLHTNYSDGKGYILEPKDTRDQYDTMAFVKELGLNFKTGFEFNPEHRINTEFSHYNGKHGAGSKVNEEEGAFDHYKTNILSTKYQGNIKGFLININVFTQWQDYHKVSESINKKKKYKLSKTFAETTDYGLFLNIQKSIFNHRLLWGIDLKEGSLEASEVYYTSTDQLDYQGKIFFYGFFAQDEIDLIPGKLQAIIGFRIDHAKFSDASLNIINPTSVTGFAQAELFNFQTNSWSRFSPKASLLWKINKKHSIYTSFSTGFMPPKLDDLVRSGGVTKGFKLANPDLKPETISSIELGGNFAISDKVELESAIYYSTANDMVYFIATGDSIITKGNKLQPILQKRNISKVEIYGFEASLNIQMNKHLSFLANYTYNHSTIKEFYDSKTAQDFQGKFIIEVPKHMASFSTYWKNKIVDITAIYKYMGKQWFDDLNSQFIQDYHIVDFKFSKQISKNLNASITVQNLFNDDFVDRKGLLNPGRFFLFELKYQF